ncbi:MAG: phosphodiesterase [Rhodobacteraceae bacterium]|nr:phosphodiesterase [Paracoccaceae bacterium]
MTRILQISDPHLTIPPEKLCGQVNTLSRLRATISAVLAAEAAQAPDAVVITGDISDNGSPESYALFRKEIERLGLPYYVIPGNHDNREAMRSAFGDAAYLPKTDRLNWVVAQEKMLLIGLDTLIEGEGGGLIDQPTADFLARALSNAPQKPALIAMHHPPFDSGIHFMDKIGLKGAGLLQEVLEHASAKTRIICGHVHNMMVGSLGDTVAISAPSPVSSFPVDYRANAPAGFVTRPGGYMLHEWHGAFRSTEIDLCEADGPFSFRV